MRVVSFVPLFLTFGRVWDSHVDVDGRAVQLRRSPSPSFHSMVPLRRHCIFFTVRLIHAHYSQAAGQQTSCNDNVKPSVLYVRK